MKSNELRIGNYVRIIETGKILSLTLSSLYQGIASDAEPIKLTEHWLVQGFGFIPNNYGGYCKTWKPSEYNDSVVEYRIGRGMNEVGYSLWQKGFEIKNSITYVHELQNLWYWLTRNEELTLLPGNSLE